MSTEFLLSCLGGEYSGMVRAVRGTARYRTGCAVEHRPLDWVSRSLKRGFEVVIVVAVLIEEMYGSGRNRPKDYRRAVVIDAGPKNTTNKTLFEVNGEARSQND